MASWSPREKWLIPELSFNLGSWFSQFLARASVNSHHLFLAVPRSSVCHAGSCSLASGQGQAVHHPALMKHFSMFLTQTGVGPGAYQKASPVCHCLHLTLASSPGLNLVTGAGWFLSVAFSTRLCLPWGRCTVSGWVMAIRKQSWCYFLLSLCYCYPFHRICIACILGWHFNNH